MRTLPIVLLCLLLLAPSLAAEQTSDVQLNHGCDTGDPDDHCHDEEEAPGVGLLAVVGLLGAVAVLRRR